MALVLAGLLAATGAIYLISAYEEPIEAAEEAQGSEEGQQQQPAGALDMGTQVQTAFFAIAGLSNIGVAVWVVIASRKGMTNRLPYLVAAAGSAILIGLYIASRTVSLPIVGLQEDVGMIDIVSKVLQGAIVAIALYTLSVSRKLAGALKNKLA
jgi:hypothetical protein